MKLAYLTSRFPFAHLGETFFVPEARLLAGLCEQVHVIPARPELRSSAFGNLGTIDVSIPPLHARTLLTALTEAVCHPFHTAVAFGRIAWPRYALVAKLKNLLLFPKALATAQYVRKNRLEHIHAHWLTTSSTVAYVVSIMTDIPWSCTAHAHDILSDNLLKEKLASARFIRVIAERNRQHLSAFTGCQAERLHVIHLGVDVPPAQPAQDHTDRPLQMICAARLDPIKGHEYLLRALAILRDRGLAFQCDIAGSGPLQEQLLSLADELDLNACVTLRGLVEHGILLEELRNQHHDVLVLPSLELEVAGKHEGIPVALIEAMAAAVPCVATATGCIPELIDERTGILVRQRDPQALAHALARIAEDRTLQRKLGRAARERILAEFNAAETTRALYDLICADPTRELIGGQSLPRPVNKPVSIPQANANCKAGKNASVATVTGSGCPLGRQRSTKSV
ncbi:MAG: glycosyltransferase family 4 protein [Burkholderiales bacterium]